MTSTLVRNPRRLLLMSALLLAIALPAPAGEADESEERLIRAEPSIARNILAAPYTLFSLTAWPIQWTVNAMEATAFPNRVADVFLFPVYVFGGVDEGEDADE